MDAADVRRAEGLPGYFRNFRRRLGGRATLVTRGAVDSGDVVERVGER